MMQRKSKALGLLRLFRFELPLFAGITVLMGEVLALGRFPSPREMLLGFLSVFCISATSLILNDYFDVETDQINAPERPLPSGLVSERDVVILSIVIMLLGFTASFMIGIDAFIVAVFIWALGFLYNWRFKRTGFLGNVLVSVAVGSTFIFGGIVVGKPFEKIVWFFGVVALLIDLGEEIAADALDMDGDREVGSKSLAIIFGQTKALRISLVIFIAVIALSLAPIIFGWLNRVFWIPLVIADVLILFAALKLVAPGTENRQKYIRLIYVSASFAMLAFLIMRLML